MTILLSGKSDSTNLGIAMEIMKNKAVKILKDHCSNLAKKTPTSVLKALGSCYVKSAVCSTKMGIEGICLQPNR